MHVGQFLLQIALPELATRAVGATRVGENKQFGGTGVVLLAVAAPPVLDRINGKRGSLSGGSDHDVAGVAANVVDSVGQRNPFGVRGEIVIFDLASYAPPGPTTTFEVAYELALFATRAILP